jgi:chromosome partitioning protein
MKVITLIQEKGGDGKTTMAINLAAGLAERGLRVLAIDTDGQANMTIGFGLNKQPGFYNLMVRSDPESEEYASWESILKILPPHAFRCTPADPGRLAIVPGNTETMNIASSIYDARTAYYRLQEVTEAFDVVIIDTSPTPSLLHGTLLIASDYVLFPTQVEYYSLSGLISTINSVRRFSTIRTDMEAGGAIQMLGVIPNKVREGTVEHSENLKKLRELYGDRVWSPIALRTSWGEAATRRMSIFTYADKERSARHAAAEMYSVVDMVMEKIGYVTV